MFRILSVVTRDAFGLYLQSIWNLKRTLVTFTAIPKYKDFKIYLSKYNFILKGNKLQYYIGIFWAVFHSNLILKVFLFFICVIKKHYESLYDY